MATVQQPHDFAKDILSAMLWAKCTTNKNTAAMLMPVRYRFGLTRPGEDFEAGLRYAIAQGWIELANGWVSFTEAGYEAA